MKHKALIQIDPKLTAPIVKSLLDDPDKELKDLKEWLLKEIALQCAVPKRHIKKK